MNAEKTTRRVFKAFGAWQDEKEERWLREMARQGWRLRNVKIMAYLFDRTEPADVVYRMDYRIVKKDEKAEYERLFRDAGWELACDSSNWKYFRAPAAAGSNPDIFSDTESRLAKYRSLLALLVILLVSQSGWTTRILTGGKHPHPVLMAFWAGLMALWVYAIVRLAIRMRKLKRGGGN